MRHYETIVIIKPNAGEAVVTAKIDKVTGIINSFDGSIVKVDNWGLKKLAYPINKEQQGIYVYFEYASAPETIAELERQLRIDDTIFKYLTVKIQDVYKPAEAVVEETAAPGTETAAEETAAPEAETTA
jgi:small subunit ribosomal protein S6